MANSNNLQIFKSWVPTWLIFATLFVFLLPIAPGLGLYAGGISTAASFYGVDNIDITYSMVVYYLAIASFFPLEARFFNYFSSKRYLIACLILFLTLNYILYKTHSFTLLFVLRFLGGMISHGVIGIVFTLVFKQFHEQRSRVLGYATMYAALFGSGALGYIMNAYVFSHYSFNSVFLFYIISIIPGAILMVVILRNYIDLRRNGRIPLKNVDWVSFVIYASLLLSVAYFFLYGQYYHWFASPRIVLCFCAIVFLLIIFVLRQIALKVPYIDLKIYKTRNFRIGMALLVVFYLGKGDLSMLNSFMTNSVHLDVYHFSYVMLINCAGIVIGSLLGARYILAGMRIRIIWLIGFGSLLAYHLFAMSVLSYQATIKELIMPLFLCGFGNGILIISIVIFYVTAVPPSIGFSASVSGVAYRSCTFVASMALTSMMGLRFQKIHHQSFSADVTKTNLIAMDRISGYSHSLLNHGTSVQDSNSGAMKLLGKAIAYQENLLFIKDYYLYISYLLGFVMILIVTTPHFSYRIKKIKSKFIPI